GAPTARGGSAAGPCPGPRPHPARPASTAPPSRAPSRPGGAAPAGGRSEVVTADGTPEPASRPTLRDLVERERWMRSAAGAPRARPPADIAYRLSAWDGVRISVGQVAEGLLAGPCSSHARVLVILR